ncbi:unnamed protein product [Lupinus luteus]|uniref:Two-component response regulator n=1 Tax=Lupinus luteus TaxID=3873 RepID=A0AAV1Y1B5_LUPLU
MAFVAVTTTNKAIEALRMLRENRNNFDLVISDMNMPDIDGFKLLEMVGLEMDLPVVIMLSAHSDTELVWKGIAHGACGHLLKPVRIEELKKIWQHVVRRTNSDGGVKPSKEEKACNISREGSQGIISESSSDRNKNLGKRSEDEEKDLEGGGEEMEEPSAQKRPRLAWTVELHKKFVHAVNQLGHERAVPRKIVELMNVEGITAGNVASHLQKYRQYLKKTTQQASTVTVIGGSDSHMRMGSTDGHVDPSRFAIASGFPHSRVIGNSANNSLPCVSSNHPMSYGNSQQTHSGAFRNQSYVRADPSSTESFDVGMYGSSDKLNYNQCNENWQTAQLSKFPANSLQLCESFNNGQLSPTGINVSNSKTLIRNSPDNFSSRIALPALLEDSRNELQHEQGFDGNILRPPSYTPRQRREEHRLDYNQSMTRPFDAVNSQAFSTSLGHGLNRSNTICSTGIDASLVGQLSGPSPSISRCNEDEKLDLDIRLQSNDAYNLEQMKSQDGFIQNEIMGAMVKRV